MRIIAFSGRARVGKSHITNTLASILWESGNYIPVVLPLAAPLKAAAAAAGFAKEEDPTGYREYCQQYGAAEREADPNHWLELWHSMFLDKMMNELNHKEEYVVIVDDVRYANELELINNLSNSTTIFIDEGSRSGTLEDDDAAWRQHHSEYLANEAHADWDNSKVDFDARFINDGMAYSNLTHYLTDGEGMGSVVNSWLGLHDCDCLPCEVHNTNDPSLLRDAAASAALVKTVKEMCDDDDDMTDEDLAAIERSLQSILGDDISLTDLDFDEDDTISDAQRVEEIIEDYLEELDALDIDEEEDEDDNE